MKTKNILRVAMIVIFILLIPLALQLTIGTGVDGQGFNWQLEDFVVMGALLFVVGLAIEFIAKRFTNPVYRRLVVIFILLIFLLIWAELAVGVFGSPWAGS